MTGSSTMITADSEWAGPAREAYDVSRAQWWETAAQLTGRLAWLRGVISVAEVNYGRAENGIVRAFTPA